MQDLAENHLDGVFYGSFPSGNGINGSDFVAELQAYHNKVFAPQTIIGTASAANGGVGGARSMPVHSGIWVPVIPVGGSPIFSTTTGADAGQERQGAGRRQDQAQTPGQARRPQAQARESRAFHQPPQGTASLLSEQSQAPAAGGRGHESIRLSRDGRIRTKLRMRPSAFYFTRGRLRNLSR